MLGARDWLKTKLAALRSSTSGLIGYASDIDIIDLAGLTDARIAHLPGGHLSKRIDPRDLQARNPDAIVVHCADTPRISEDDRLLACAGFEVERRVLAMPFVQAGYRVGHVARGHAAPRLPIELYVRRPRARRARRAYGTPRKVNARKGAPSRSNSLGGCSRTLSSLCMRRSSARSSAQLGAAEMRAP